MPENIRSIREARRLAMLARDIVAEHTGPWKTLEAWTRKQPEAMVLAAFLVGVVASCGVRLRRAEP